MSLLPCEIIRDLLPLYRDQVCSAESSAAVKEHLSQCAACQGTLVSMDADIRASASATTEDISAGAAMRALGRRWRRSKLLMTLTYLLAILAFALCSLYAYYALFLEDVVPIPASQVEVAYMYRQPDGTLWYRLRIKDGKAPQGSSWTGTQYSQDTEMAGKVFETTLRPRIVLGNDPNALSGEIGVGGFEDGKTDVQLYYGTPEDNILLWEPGMDIPVLTEEEAAQYVQGILEKGDGGP